MRIVTRIHDGWRSLPLGARDFWLGFGTAAALGAWAYLQGYLHGRETCR